MIVSWRPTLSSKSNEVGGSVCDTQGPVRQASRLLFGPDDADDAVAVFAFDPAIPAAEVAIDVAEGSHLFGHYVGPGSAQTLHGHFMRDVVAHVAPVVRSHRDGASNCAPLMRRGETSGFQF
jgi:hypothetical protein